MHLFTTNQLYRALICLRAGGDAVGHWTSEADDHRAADMVADPVERRLIAEEVAECMGVVEAARWLEDRSWLLCRTCAEVVDVARSTGVCL